MEDEKIRDQQFAQSILEAMQRLPVHQDNGVTNWKQAAVPQLLLEPQNEELAENEYKSHLKELSRQVATALRHDERQVVIVFEGMDAAGKGGAIKRIVKSWTHVNIQFIALLPRKNTSCAVLLMALLEQTG